LPTVSEFPTEIDTRTTSTWSRTILRSSEYDW